jgi:hypothetical protein
MARTRFYIDWLFPRRIHFTDFSHPAVYAAVVQAGRVENYRRIETVLVAVVLVDWVLRIAELMRVRRKLWIVKIVDTKNEVGCIINVLQEHISLDTVADVFNGKRNFGGNDCSHYKNRN